jgi:4-hydroxy-3-methylbut-2-en-1-yl diphosphate reductase
VWNRADKLGKENYTVIIHGKPKHEETRATFSHSASGSHSIIVRDMDDAIQLSNYILGSKSPAEFFEEFAGKISTGFNPEVDLQKVGVVNQTTMLATETQAIADFIRQVMIKKFGEATIKEHFADTRDTLCYATNDNQDSTYQLLKADADLAIVVGGYNSSNTSHIVELCERTFSTYFINSDSEIKSNQEIHHFNFHKKELATTFQFLPEKKPLKIILTSGASCPDTLVDRVMLKLVSYFDGAKSIEEVLKDF